MCTTQLPQHAGSQSPGLQYELTASHQFRNNRIGNRQTRTTQIDHDVFEGLPVRHWRKKTINVNVAPEKDTIRSAGLTQNGYGELPLPRDFQMLSESSQILLRAARMDLRRRSEAVVEDKENEENEAAAAGGEGNGFLINRWTLVPRELEGPEPEYLAKRRKGLPSVYRTVNGDNGLAGPMKKTRIRRTDSNGNTSVWEVLVPEGQAVHGEIVEHDARDPTIAMPGTVVDGIGVVNAEGLIVTGEQPAPAPAPVRRRPPIPQKKKKLGPGRGRKKILEPARETAQNGDVQVNGNSSQSGWTPIKQDDRGGQMIGDDSSMQDVHQDEDEGSDEGSEEGDEEREEGELSPSPEARQAVEDDVKPKPEPPSLSIALSPSEAIKGAEVDDLQPSAPAATPGSSANEVKMEIDEKPPTPPASDLQTVPEGLPTPIDIPLQPYIGEPAASVSPGQVDETPIRAFSEAQVTQPSTQPTPPHQEVTANLDHQTPPLDGINSTQQATRLVEAADVIDLPVTKPDIASPPPIPQTASQFPKLPSSLPPLRSPTPPPQHMPQPPPTLSPAQQRRASVSTRQPTPIETAFAQGLSPKAPTMSPPTPVPQDLDSSPETALAFKQPRYAEPPPFSLDDTRASVPLSIPGLQLFQQPQRAGAKDGPRVDNPHYSAGISHAHDPLDGLAAPEVPSGIPKLNAPPKRPSIPGLGYVDGGIDVEAALRFDRPHIDAELPHTHNLLERLKAPDVLREQRRLERSGVEGREEDVVRFEDEDEDEDFLGTHDKDLQDSDI